MAVKREIYSVGFNRSVSPDGTVNMYGYSLGIPSRNGGRIPEKIMLDDNYVCVTFTDNSRHMIPLSGGVEIMDRIVEPKNKKDGGDNKNRTDKKTT